MYKLRDKLGEVLKGWFYTSDLREASPEDETAVAVPSIEAASKKRRHADQLAQPRELRPRKKDGQRASKPRHRHASP